MQLKIDIEFTDSKESLLFDLLDNPGVHAWANHCKTIPPDRLTTTQILVPTSAVFLDYSNIWIQQQLVQNSLAATTLPMPMPVTAQEQITQEHLNVWHRWFTHHTNIINHNPATWTELATENYWLNELNQIVHRLENSIWEWPKPDLGVCGHDLNLQPNVDAHGYGGEFVDLKPYRQYHSWEVADLILDQAVHGKTTMQSFIDNDDPRHWDTTGHHMSWGGCKLVSKHYRQTIYQGHLFGQWMNRYNLTHQDLWGDYPLGNIVNRDQAQLDRIFDRIRPSRQPQSISVELAILD
jgi:hypothetical protein